ncbi:hypothetical protein NEIELOOT_02834 [Neisseria elongata subsp. glycolytica ATCC 29315]|uniref:Uncharacterized protein n=1 Tax=Neisseria elongata subsp. glycolytica ATCC 29315 TaxID=546263 RepID=D4DUN9_NEIEG|nr:hypothetical protein NEIELOOT_02834 [Neisseria elongata subsp. glycolytica ATCC 29315]
MIKIEILLLPNLGRLYIFQVSRLLTGFGPVFPGFRRPWAGMCRSA